MDNNELETFIKMFDAALCSDNPSVKKALKNLLIITTLQQDDKYITKGPLETLFQEMKLLAAVNNDMKFQLSHLNNRLHTIESNFGIHMQKQVAPWARVSGGVISEINWGVSDINGLK